ncbi:hypothetical protein QL285_010531 [Trifolium repens]|nr:hypothetical protein QL285_010531 [Trifolium repens]
MGDEQRITMGDYCKMTDTDQISLGFQPANPANFDIKGNVLTGLRENQFDERANNDPIPGIISQSFQRHVRSRRCRKTFLMTRRSCVCLLFLLQVQLKIDFNACQGERLQHGRSLKTSSWKDSSHTHYSRRGSLRF